MALGPLTVNVVKASGLDLTVNEGTSETGKDLLGLLVARGLAYTRIISNRDGKSIRAKHNAYRSQRRASRRP